MLGKEKARQTGLAGGQPLVVSCRRLSLQLMPQVLGTATSTLGVGKP